MREEDPLLQFEMTPEEADFALTANKKSIKSSLSSNLVGKALLIMVSSLLAGLLVYAFEPNNLQAVATAIVQALGVILLLSGISVGSKFILMKADPEVIISPSGVCFLGQFHPLKIHTYFLTTAVCTEAQGNDPALLRLTLEQRQPFPFGSFVRLFYRSTFTLEIPLRPEMIEHANLIIKTLLPE